MIFLKLIGNGCELGDYRFEQETVAIGGGEGVDVRLDGTAIGLRATIAAATLMLSASGGEVRLNGQPTASAVLENGDVIGIGGYDLRFYHSKPSATVAFADTRTWKVPRPDGADAGDVPTPGDGKTIKL